MKLRIHIGVLLLATLPEICLCQMAQTPLNHAEILGRLASGSSPSYIAHLVKTRGINFSPDAYYLSLISLAGGNGILFKNLSAASAINSGGPLSAADPPFEHLAKCAEFLQRGAFEQAETACRAAIVENPNSPWPLLATLRSLERKEKTPETLDMARRAVALAPDLVSARLYLLQVLPQGAELNSELQRAATRTPDELEPEEIGYPFVVGGSRMNDVVPTQQQRNPRMEQLLKDKADFASAHVHAAYFYEYRQDDREHQDRDLSEMRAAIALEPDNWSWHAALAQFLASRGDTDSQIAELREAVRAQSDGHEPRLELARALQSLARLSEAATEFQNLLALYPLDSMASAMLVDIYLEQKNRRSAIVELRRFLKAASLGVDAQTHAEQTWAESNRLAAILHNNGELDAAAAQYLEMLHYRPDNADAHNDYGNVLLDQLKFDEAAQQYQEALRYNPEMATAHHNLALALSRLGKQDAAIAEFQNALQLNPQEPNSRASLGVALGMKGDLDGAIEEFKAAILQNPKDAYAHANLGHALELQHDAASAVTEFKLALDLDPDILAAENDLAWILATDARLRDPAAALLHARRAVELLPSRHASPQESSASLDTLAEALLLNGKSAEALETENKALAIDPDNAELKSRLSHFRDAASPKKPR